MLIHTSVTRLTAARQINTIHSLASCNNARISPYILLTSDVMLLWMTKCGAGYVSAVQRYNLYNATPRLLIETVAIDRRLTRAGSPDDAYALSNRYFHIRLVKDQSFRIRIFISDAF